MGRLEDISGPETEHKSRAQNSFSPMHVINSRVDLHILLGGEHVLLALLKTIVEHILKDVDRLLVCA